ncbi:MAG: DUF1573 domain-containing protein [Bacteroidales bacterium]
MKSLYRIIIYLLCGWVSCLYLKGQTSSVTIPEWNKSEHDFGLVLEDDSLQYASFILKNNGPKPLLITRVITTCGCMATQYTRSMIAPGKTGEVQVSFSPQGRMGKFQKSVQVHFQDKNITKRLFIYGEIKKGIPRKFDGYPFMIGSLQLKNNQLKFKSNINRMQVQSILVINSADTPIEYTFTSNHPGITARIIPARLNPGESGELEVYCEKNINPKKIVRLLPEWKEAGPIDSKKQTINISFYP